jgi:hypothetical protein
MSKNHSSGKSEMSHSRLTEESLAKERLELAETLAWLALRALQREQIHSDDSDLKRSPSPE